MRVPPTAPLMMQTGTLLALHQPPAQFHAPVADLRVSRRGCGCDRVAPVQPRTLRARLGMLPKVRIQSLRERRVLLAEVGRDGVGLAVDQVGVAADQVADAVCSTVSRSPVFAPNSTRYLISPGLSFTAKAYDLSAAGFGVWCPWHELVVGVEPQKDRVGRLGERAVVMERALVRCRRGRRTGRPPASRPFAGVRATQASLRRLRDGDRDRLGGRRAAVVDVAVTVSVPLFCARLRMSLPGAASLIDRDAPTRSRRSCRSPAALARIASGW